MIQDIDGILRELRDPISGARLEKVHQRDSHSILLALRPRREVRDENFSRLFLCLSIRPGFERIHLVEERGVVSDSPGAFAMALRKRIRGARVKGIRKPDPTRAVEIDLEVYRGEGEEPARWILAADLSRGSPGILLLDGDRSPVAALNPASGEGAPHGKRPPDTGPPPPPLPDGKGEFLAGRFPLNIALSRRVSREEAGILLGERREALQKGIAQTLKKRRKLRERLQGDLEGARRGEEGLRLGELLKAELHRLKRGMDRVEVVDYYSGDLRKVTIPLDPGRSPRENVEKYFQRHRKARRAVPIITGRLARLEEEISRLQELGGSASRVEGEAALEDLEQRARPFLRNVRKQGAGRRAGGGAAKQGRQAPVPGAPRKFISRDGMEILVGRSARENETLTFRIARGNDLFLHVAGRPGAHVVVRTPREKSVPPETLSDAAQLALYYSLPVRSRGHIARGAAADVDYVQVKHVRKPRGGKPGEVLLASHRTLRVQLDEERLDRLRRGGPET